MVKKITLFIFSLHSLAIFMSLLVSLDCVSYSCYGTVFIANDFLYNFVSHIFGVIHYYQDFDKAFSDGRASEYCFYFSAFSVVCLAIIYSLFYGFLLIISSIFGCKFR
jgi:hypothetical protein